MKKILPFLLVFLVVFTGCGDDDDVSPLEEAETMLQGKWRSVSVKYEIYRFDKSELLGSGTTHLNTLELEFSQDSVIFNHYRALGDILSSSTTEELKLSERAGRRYLMLQTDEYEVIHLDWDNLQLMRTFDLGDPLTIREQTFTYNRAK